MGSEDKTNGALNGTGRPLGGDGGPASAAAPANVLDLADGCVRFVERALGVRLDYEPETLPLVDHYLQEARGAASIKPEAAGQVSMVLAHAVGAYFGEVIRRRHASWWSAGSDDPSDWQIQLEPVYLAVHPVEVVRVALEPTRTRRSEALDPTSAAAHESEGESEGDGEADGEVEGGGDLTLLELDEEDRATVAERLADLPAVSEDEYRSLSTLLEVIDIAVDAIRSRRIAAGEPEPHLTPRDYDQ